MAAVLRPLLERPESTALDELEALREAITAEKGRVAQSYRRWLLHHAAVAREEDVKDSKDAEYIALLERQNALLKKRVASLEETNQNLAAEKESILRATESSRRMIQPNTSVLSGELSRLSEQCRQLRRTEEQNLQQLSAKGSEISALRTQVEELQLTLRAKEEDIAQLTRMQSEALSRARRGGDAELERATEERRKAVEELITARSTIERLQRDLTAAQQELKSVSGELRDERSATDKHLVQARQVDEALKQLLPIDSAGEGTSALDKVAVVGQLLRKAKSDLQAEQSKRHAADHLVLEQRTEAEERLRREAEAALQERKALQAEFEQQLHALRQQVKNLDSQLGAAQAKAMEQSEAARAALEMKAADESAIAEHAAVEELLSEAQARIAALESKEALHEDEVRSARESQQKAQWALANQLAAAEAALLQERATMLRLTTERDKGWADATARKRTELPVALIPEELKGQSKEALFAQLQEVFFAEAQARLLGQ